MKYTVTVYIPTKEDDEVFTEHSTIVSVRSDATNKTVFKRCINEIGWKLVDEGILPEKVKYGYDLPNIWTNGYFGAAWFCDPFYDIHITEENGAALA